VVEVGVVRLTAGDSAKLSELFEVMVKYASGVIVPPTFFGRRAVLDTVGVPLGGVAVSVTLPPPDPLVVAGTCSVALMLPVIGPSVTDVGPLVDAVKLAVDEVPLPPTPPPGGVTEPPPPPPPPPHAASASATEKSKGRASRRWVMRIAFVSSDSGCSLNTFETSPDQAERRHRRTFSDIGTGPRKRQAASLNLTVP
jgi:hypothetical protein